VELNDLKVITKGGISSKENVETPRLKGNIKVANKGKDLRIIDRVTLEYLDETGKPVLCEPEEKTVIGSPWTQWGWNAWGVGRKTLGKVRRKDYKVKRSLDLSLNF